MDTVSPSWVKLVLLVGLLSHGCCQSGSVGFGGGVEFGIGISLDRGEIGKFVLVGLDDLDITDDTEFATEGSELGVGLVAGVRRGSTFFVDGQSALRETLVYGSHC